MTGDRDVDVDERGEDSDVGDSPEDSDGNEARAHSGGNESSGNSDVVERRADSGVDVEELRGDLEQIKEAMGIRERYSGATSLWVLFGLAVPVASALSQYVLLERLPQWYFSVIWIGVLSVGLGLYALFEGGDHRSNWRVSQGKPNIPLQFGIVYLSAILVQEIAFEYAGELGYVAESGMAFSLILLMLGVGYGVIGSSMRAYHVRRRDRAVFYAGSVWMGALAVAIPQSSFLETWAYAVFGGAYFVYAAVAYLAMRSGGDVD